MATETIPKETTLPRVLGPLAALCVVVGSVIGSGIFMVPADVARATPAMGPIVAVWVIGGIFSTFGALTLAELGAMLPQAGGPYVYLREAYGRLPAFLFGWSEFLINRTGSMATLSTAFSQYFAQIVGPPQGMAPEVWQAGAAITAITMVVIVNVLGTAIGGGLQVIGTALKVGGVSALIVLPFVVGGGKAANLSPVMPEAFDLRLVSPLTETSGIPIQGRNLVTISNVNDVLYFRIFNRDKNIVFDSNERLLKGKSEQIENLRKELSTSWPPQKVTEHEKRHIITNVASISGRTLLTGFDASLLTGMMVAMVGVLWAYDGWMNLTPLAEDVRDPGRNIPWALGMGMAVLVTLYLGATLAYHYVLTIDQVEAAKGAATEAVAATYCKTLLGQKGLVAISLLVMASTFISLNGNALTGPRAYFAMSRDGLFPGWLARIHPTFQTPANAVIAQGVWAIGLIVAGTVMILWPAPGPDSGLPEFVRNAWLKLNTTPLYKILFTYVVFGANVFYLLAIASVFVLRMTRPDAPRPYKTWGYPFTPLIFVIASLYLLQNMLRESPAESLAGVGIILAGIPAYLVFARSTAANDALARRLDS